MLTSIYYELRCFQALLRDVEKQQGRMDDVLADQEDLRPAKGAEGEEPTKEEELADELAQLKNDAANKIKRLQVQCLWSKTFTCDNSSTYILITRKPILCTGNKECRKVLRLVIDTVDITPEVFLHLPHNIM